jgi:D-hydroxyproline dehydrogenase subunit beta
LTGAHRQENESIALNVQPRAEGRVLIGASRQYGTTDNAVEERIVAKLLTRAASYLPGIERVPIERIWTGFRAATPDGLPLIGWHPTMEGVVVATGHEGLGITTAIATGQLIADLVAERPPAIGTAAFDPGRKPAWLYG